MQWRFEPDIRYVIRQEWVTQAELVERQLAEDNDRTLKVITASPKLIKTCMNYVRYYTQDATGFVSSGI